VGTDAHPLEPWQIFIVMTVFSWVWATAAFADPEIAARDGFRRFRTGYTEVPRKNAKSTLTSGIGLYMTAPMVRAVPSATARPPRVTRQRLSGPMRD
jgi:phage terminase large subunit-like protein